MTIPVHPLAFGQPVGRSSYWGGMGRGDRMTGQFCRKLQLTEIQPHHICTWVSYRIDHCVQSCANNSPWQSKKRKKKQLTQPRKLRENLSFSRSPNNHQKRLSNIIIPKLQTRKLQTATKTYPTINKCFLYHPDTTPKKARAA